MANIVFGLGLLCSSVFFVLVSIKSKGLRQQYVMRPDLDFPGSRELTQNQFLPETQDDTHFKGGALASICNVSMRSMTGMASR